MVRKTGLKNGRAAKLIEELFSRLVSGIMKHRSETSGTIGEFSVRAYF